MNITTPIGKTTSGEFTEIEGETYYVIREVDGILPFFTSIVSSSDHWLFVASNGGLTAGRVSPETALFPYIPVDKVYDSVAHTGCKTILRVDLRGATHLWEPFNPEHNERYAISRNLYKSTLGDRIRFEEINHDLKLAFAYTWSTSDRYGFIRACELKNTGDEDTAIDLLDGFQNILPAGTPALTQSNSSNLVDAYKWNEFDPDTGLALFTLFSAISDRAEPCESLRANTVFSLGLETRSVLLSSRQLEQFRNGATLETEHHMRGIRGSYFVGSEFSLAAKVSKHWNVVADVEQTQADIVALMDELREPETVLDEIETSTSKGSDRLARIMGGSDGFQCSAEQNVFEHHYANVLFNVLRGGIFDDQYRISADDFRQTIGMFNKDVYLRNSALLDSLPQSLNFEDLVQMVRESGNFQLERLCSEYLPIYFGRRHGDPSRPWNSFAIRIKDDAGKPLLSYQGNWRDIFQNWEALSLSYPEFLENIIAKFVNASTVEGYNPYRITKEGIDWEVEDPDDPWSYIGYWGDHQIIYLLKLLELSRQYHPSRLSMMLRRPIFCYANVPYRIRPIEKLLQDAKSTVDYDKALARKIELRVDEMGADGKLVLDSNGDVYQVNLLEKLLVPLLSKLGNLVVDGGIWLNTQRPEWNDANNALVGQGLSMVTLYYLRRYARFLGEIIEEEGDEVSISREVSDWLSDTADILSRYKEMLSGDTIAGDQKFSLLNALGQASSRYRSTFYQQASFSGTVTVNPGYIKDLLKDAQEYIDHSIASNEREDGLYHAYNLLRVDDKSLAVSTLYPMLEGQVSVLSSGLLTPEKALSILEALFDSEIYRRDQDTFMLYPDRPQSGFLDKNCIAGDDVESNAFLMDMLRAGDSRIVCRDARDVYRFNADLTNVGELRKLVELVCSDYGYEYQAVCTSLEPIYENVFNHQAFTGRSGGMFGFEGLGCIYWHMVAKLLLAVQENFFSALDQGASPDISNKLGKMYYRVREGLGFNKTPTTYGAFPTDPYSHTPGHSGAQQPGMTGQVKEEIIARFGELGVRVDRGQASFQPWLLREQEFLVRETPFRYLDVDNTWQEVSVPAPGLGFTWCQVPILYSLLDAGESHLIVNWDDGRQEQIAECVLPAAHSAEIFRRSGKIRSVNLALSRASLFKG